MTDVNTVADPSAATTTPVQYDSWDEHGTPIVSKPAEPPKKQDSAPADAPKEAKSEPEGKSAAEPEAAKSQEKKGGKKTAEERIAELVSEVKSLREAERERSRAQEPKPAEKKVEAQPQEAPKRPNPYSWTGTPEEFEAAMDKYEQWRDTESLRKHEQLLAQREAGRKLQEQVEAVKQKYPDAEEKIKATMDSMVDVQLPGVIRSMLDDSEVLPELIYVFSDETTRNKFIETAKSNPGKAIRVLAQMEADIQAKAKAPVVEKKEAKEEPPAEPKPRAPKPAAEVGGRGTAPEDAAREAARTGDFRSFEAEMNRRMRASAPA